MNTATAQRSEQAAYATGVTDDPTALGDASEAWLAWVKDQLVSRPPASRLLALWVVLEAWFSSEDFQRSPLPVALAGAKPDRGSPAHGVVERHRSAFREFLEELTAAAGAHRPAELADSVRVLVEGAIVGAIIDRQPVVAEYGRALTEVALASEGSRAPGR